MAADVVVNEIMYQATSHSEGDEWIELYNRGATPANLTGWKISKGVDYTFTGGTLNPGGYLVVAAEVAKFQAKYPGVTNVVGGWTGRLSNSQEQIQLEDNGGSVVDGVTYSDQGDWAKRRRGVLDNAHMGWDWVQPASGLGSSLEVINPALTNNFGQNWDASTTPQGTPGAVNSVFSPNVAPLITDLKQSILVPTSSQSVKITAKLIDESGAPQSASLFYRVDAAAPPAFTQLAMVDNGTNGDALAGDGIWTATIPAQANLSVVEFYVSATDGTLTRTWPAPTDTGGTQGANALYQVDDTPYSGTQPLYKLIMTKAERDEIVLIGSKNPDAQSNAQMNATFIAIDSTGSQIRYNAGVRNRGHGSRVGTPNNYHVAIPTDNPWKGKTAINFNARTVFSQVLGSAIWRMGGFAAPDIVPIQVRVNGANLQTSGGSYALAEEPGSDFAANHFPQDANGNYYGAFRLDSGAAEAELLYLGADPNSYRPLYSKDTNSEADDYSDLIRLVGVLNNTPANLLLQEVSKVLNLDQWLHYLALDNLLGNGETGLVSGIGDDYGMYRGVNDPRFVLVPHDMDTLLAAGGRPVSASIFGFVDSGGSGPSDGVSGLKKLFALPEVQQLYYRATLDMMQRVFNPTVMNPLVDLAIGNFASPSEISAAKNYVSNRTTAVLAQIPQQFAIGSNLPVVDGYQQTNQPAATVSGSANASVTRSVLVNGRPAVYNPRTGAWSLAATGGSATNTVSIFPSGSNSVWTYLDDGTNQGTAWRGTGFNDSTWATGRAQFGFGDGDEVTPVNNNPSRVTTYFRKVFNVADKSAFSGLLVHLMRDDGAVVWLNGNRVISSNITTGAVNFTTQPLGNLSAPDENTFVDYPIGTNFLNNGSNVIAVEMHNFTSGASQDMSFDLGLDGVVTSAVGNLSGGVPLHPGVNRVTVQAFDGANGTGKEVNRGFVDIWYTGTNNGAFAPSVPVDGLTMTVPADYRPGTPFLVQVQANNAGQLQRDLWDGTVTLTSDRPDINLSTNQVVLRNGYGSVMVMPTGAGTASGSFTLSATLGNRVAAKSLTTLNGAAITNVSGTLAGTSSTWSGVVHVTGNVTVPAGHTLTIAPGTLVLVDGVASGTAGPVILVNGKVQSQGSAQQPVTITAFNSAQNWGGLRFTNAQASSFLYTFISKAGNTAGLGHTNTGPAVRSSGTTLTFDHSAITDNLGKAGDMSGSSLTFLYSEISRSRMGPEIATSSVLLDHSFIFDMRGADDADGIYLHDQLAGQTITLQHSVIGALDDDDVDTLGSVVTLDDMVLRDAKDKGVSVLNGAVTIKNSLIAGNSLQSEDATFSSVSAKVAADGDTVTVNIDHTTIVANDPQGLGRDVGIESRNKYGVASGTVNYNVTNSVISATKPVSVEAPHVPATVLISYSNTFGTNWTGTGNLNINPLFADPANHDYHLKPGSPSINAGNPAAANNDADGSRGDQGVFRNGLAGTRAPTTIPAGTLSGVMILSPENGPYVVTGDVVVPAGATLYVLPGTSVYFKNGAGLTVNGGRIVAEGTEYEQIRFTREPGTTAVWDGLQLANTNLDNRLTWAVLENAQTTTHDNGLLGVSTSRVTIDHVYFDRTDRRRLRFNNASIVLRNSEFADIFPGATAPSTDNLSEHIWGSGILAGGQMLFENNVFGVVKGHNDAIDIDTATRPGPIFVIRNNVFNGGGDDAMDLEGDALIEGNLFSNFIKDQYNTGTGNSNILSAGLGHDYTMVRNTVVNSEHVAQVKELSFLTFVNNTVVGGPTNTAAIYFFRPAQANSWGKGAYIDGNVFKDKPLILADYTNTTQITLNRSIVPAAYLGFGTGNTSEDPRLVAQPNGTYALRAGSPAKGSGPNGLDMGALVPQWASISGEPASHIGKTSATITVGGPAITHYKYRLNSGAWSAETPVATPINLSGLTNGEYTVFVIGKNDAGEWQDVSAPTVSRTWAVDTITPSIRINEVLAINNNYLSNNNQFPDLIELYNHGDAPVDLNGMSITDTSVTPRKLAFTTSTIINPGQYLILYADSKTVAGQIHTGFSLKGDGEGVYLFNTLAAGGGQIDGVTFGSQLDNLSIGRGADGSWGLNQPTFGAANVAQRTGDAATIRINEWNTAGVAPYADDFVELYNPDPLPVALGGYYLSDKPIPQPGKSLIPDLTFVAANAGTGGFATFIADSQPDAGGLHTNFGLSADQGMIGLFDPSQTKIDWVLYLTQRLGQSHGRTPDGGTVYTYYANPSPGLPNPGVTTSTLPLRITEINYHPPSGSGLPTASDYEFVEFKNTSASTINLNGVSVAGAVNFTFGNIDLAAGQYVVIVRDPAAFAARFGAGINVGGTFSDALNDNGGQLRLLDSLGATVLDFGYSDLWQPSTDGDGDTLVLIDPAAPANTWGLASSWRASRAVLGTPGIDEAVTLNPPSIVINEILAHTAGNASDWIELRNTTGASVDISGWYLSNDSAGLLKYRLPAGSIVPANGYLVLNQAASFGSPAIPNGFALRGDGGELYLSSSVTPGVLTGYRQGVTFGASDPGVSLGRHTTSTGAVDFVALSAPTKGAANAYPAVGPIVITEIMYHPGGSSSEFVELHNNGNQPVDLSSWKFTNGIDFTFAAGTSIAPGAYLLVVPTTPAAFRALYDIPASVQIVGPFTGALDNNGETVELSRPGVSETGALEIPFVVADRVAYGTSAPWAAAPDGTGPSLARKGQSLYGNDPANWVADATDSHGSPGVGSDLAAPTVSGAQVYVEGKTIRFVFSKDVSATLDRADLVLQNLTTGQTINSGSLTLTYDASTRSGTWTSPTVFADGNYTATLTAAGISDTGLHALDGNGDGVAGDNYALNFFVLAGDSNRDRVVSFADLVKVAQNYDASGSVGWADGDFDGDGLVGFSDLVAVAQHYDQTLPAPAAALPAVSAPAETAPVTSAKTTTTTPAKPTPPKPAAKPVTPRPAPVAPAKPTKPKQTAASPTRVAAQTTTTPKNPFSTTRVPRAKNDLLT